MKPPFLIFLCFLALVGCTPEKEIIPGYVEGDFVAIAPTSSGVLEKVRVVEGQTVKPGDILFSLDLVDLQAQYDGAVAAKHRAQAELNDLLKGERPEELEVLFKQSAQARANLENAQKDYNRTIPLSKTGAVSLSRRDDVIAALDTAKARVEEVNAQITAANLGARIDRIEAARAGVEIEKQKSKQIEKRLQEAAPMAGVEATVMDVFFRPGEYVGAGQSVVKLLPPANIKIKFFVSQEKVATLKIGQNVFVSCDGCDQSYAARITHIAEESEYTPPVIFSVESRDKLVFMVEAHPTEFHEALRVGLPVTVEVGPGS